jgi:hypothetical protein
VNTGNVAASARLQRKQQAAVTADPAGATGIPWAMVYGLSPELAEQFSY